MNQFTSSYFFNLASTIKKNFKIYICTRNGNFEQRLIKRTVNEQKFDNNYVFVTIIKVPDVRLSLGPQEFLVLRLQLEDLLIRVLLRLLQDLFNCSNLIHQEERI